MVSVREVNKQLKSTGYNYRVWMRKEIRELSKVLDEGEAIKQCVNGFYQGGLALLAATDRRLILIDCKPMYLTLEVIWYDKIGQIDYNHRLLNASICVSTPNKELNFTSYNTQHLRQALLYTQEMVAELGRPEGSESQQTPSNISFRGQADAKSRQALSPIIAAPRQTPDRRIEYDTSELPTQSPHHLPVEGSTFRVSSARLPFSRRRYFSPQESEPLA
jgi:hypothetical protein